MLLQTGAYHGLYGINGFSHIRTVVNPPLWLERFIGFRYPPLNIANKGKLAVTNKMGFKKGETMEDQVIGKKSLFTATNVGLVTAAVAATAIYLR